MFPSGAFGDKADKVSFELERRMLWSQNYKVGRRSVNKIPMFVVKHDSRVHIREVHFSHPAIVSL